MDRRELLILTPNLFWLTLLGTKGCRWAKEAGSTSRLFFDPEDVSRIRANASSPLLEATFQKWAAYDDTESREIIQKPLKTGDLISDLGGAFRRMEHLGMVYLVNEDPTRVDLIRRGIDMALELPKWDYFLDGETEMGIMRASQAVGSMLFLLEVLEEKLDKPLVDEIYRAVADKGTELCNVAIRGMDNPERVKGWHADEKHTWRYYFDMSRWPEIFSGHNLRAVPTMGLGLGGLALEGRDDRAADWLQRAVGSARTFLAAYEPDGSYFEGLSYVNYASITLFTFLEAYNRLKGDINWMEYANFEGITRYIAVLQAGRQYDEDVRDIVNFSDARGSTTVGVNAWLARHTKYPLAQYNAEHFSTPGHVGDFLWYKPDLPSAPPPSSLKNVRLDLDWVIARSGWEDEDAVLAFRSGRPANHEHADRNTFLYKVYGERLLTDHFGAAYEYTKPHWLLRLTEAHNGALIDGKGHQYVDGSEGTNAGKAHAKILKFVDEDEVVWWVSDATQGYQLVNPNVALVRRSMMFLKPDWVIILDECETQNQPTRLGIRFFPDDRDKRASLAPSKNAFLIRRPRASLRGWVRSASGLEVRGGALDLPDEYGHFPYMEVESNPSREIQIVSVLHASKAGTPGPTASVQLSETEGGWRIQLPHTTIAIGMEEGIPLFARG
jgi:hypothetical protein